MGKKILVFEPYTQVFGKKHGFLNNLSILDLLFNEGRHALDYLKNRLSILFKSQSSTSGNDLNSEFREVF